MTELTKRTKKYLVAAMWLLAIVGVGFMGWMQMSRPKPRVEVAQPDKAKKVTPQDQNEDEATIQISGESMEIAHRLKNLGLAQIENEKYAAAQETLKQLRELIPVDGFVERNLLIAAILRMQSEQGIAAFGGESQLRDSVVSHSLELEFDRAVSRYLVGRLYEQEKNFEGAMEKFRESTEINEDFVSGWYSAFTILKTSPEEGSRREGLEMLRKGTSLLPDNLFLQVELLHYEAELKEKRVTETLEALLKLIEPFRKGIEERTRINFEEIAAQGKQGVEEKNWANVLRTARVLTNVLRPEEIYQADKSQVEPHLSSYLFRDFTVRYPGNPSASELTPPIEITWQRWKPEGIEEIGDSQDLIVEDFDLDGRLDICILRLETLDIYSREPEGQKWKKILSIDLPQGYQRLMAVDLDNDFEESRGIPVPQGGDARPPCQSADLDIIVYGSAGIAAIENRYDSKTDKRELSAKPFADGLNSQTAVRAASTGDLDGDGDLDLVVGRTGSLEIWSNRGGMEFYDISNRSSLPSNCAMNTILIVDADQDVDQDVLLLGGENNGLLVNQRHGRFQWVKNTEETAELLSQVADAESGGMSRRFGRGVFAADESGVFEIFPFGSSEAGSADKRVLSESAARRLRIPDLDNNGVTDFISWGEAGLLAYEMQRVSRAPNRRATWIPRESLAIEGRILGADYGDLDRDGDLDLIWCDEKGLQGATNEGGNKNHWLDLSLIAQQIRESGPTASGRVNSHGLGSNIELKTGRDYQSVVVSRPTTHFGLGNRERVDVCRILWANGIPANLIDPKQNEFLCEQQTLKGSCPYLYSWNGEKIEFVTDLLWGAPVGLQVAEGVLATPREWEYLKIPGRFIQARDSEYDLRITEELWEAAYFDEVKLYAVDHPEEIEIETNEKVGPPSVAEHRIFTARNRRLPVSARDAMGNDLLPQLSKTDDVYVATFHNKLRQGLAEEHYLELDFGELSRFEQLHLYLSGWLYPTDTSINVAASNDPRLSSPKPPSIQVPDDQGNWREVVPFSGFPGGKTKSVVYDLSKIFLTEDYRVRLVSNMEFYWDSVYFTVDEPGEKIEMAELPLKEAVLRYRGFSAVVPHPRNGPERYDYQSVSEAAKWPNLGGKLTRYADVTDLVREGDDRLVVMAGGDELKLRFGVLAKSPPPGWKRDFVLYNVGWDKDADLNTVAGSSVEPLPYRKMDTYPPISTDGSPEWDSSKSEAYRNYLSTYQTRTQSPRSFWSHVLSSNLNQRP